MLKPINIQLKFTKDDIFFVILNHLNQNRISFDKTLRKNTSLNKVKYLKAIKIKITKFEKKWFKYQLTAHGHHPLDGDDLVAVKWLIHQEVPTRVRQREESFGKF